MAIQCTKAIVWKRIYSELYRLLKDERFVKKKTIYIDCCIDGSNLETIFTPTNLINKPECSILIHLHITNAIVFIAKFKNAMYHCSIQGGKGNQIKA